MKKKTNEWIIVTQRDGIVTVLHVGSIVFFEQNNMVCRINTGGSDLHVRESDKEIMKMVLEGVEFDV